MKQKPKSNKLKKFARRKLSPANKETIPASEDGKPIFSASELKITPPRTVDDIRRDIREGRFAEMTPDQAG
jgi:hypothetical protein